MPKRAKPRGRITIAAGETYRVQCCDAGHIHIDVMREGSIIYLEADPEEAYEFAQAILRGYDQAVGI